MTSLMLFLTDFRWNVWKGQSLKKKIYVEVSTSVWSDRALPMELIRVNPLAKISAHYSELTLSSSRGRKSLQSALFSLSVWVICSVWGRATGNKWGRALRSINFRQLTLVNSWGEIHFPVIKWDLNFHNFTNQIHTTGHFIPKSGFMASSSG